MGGDIRRGWRVGLVGGGGPLAGWPARPGRERARRAGVCLDSFCSRQSNGCQIRDLRMSSRISFANSFRVRTRERANFSPSFTRPICMRTLAAIAVAHGSSPYFIALRAAKSAWGKRSALSYMCASPSHARALRGSIRIALRYKRMTAAWVRRATARAPLCGGSARAPRIHCWPASCSRYSATRVATSVDLS